MNCLRIHVSGRVQGVFFRDSTRRRALQLGITGQAINLPDGRVEVIACGEQPALDQLLEWLQQGPELARVDRVDVEVMKEIPKLYGFAIG